MIKIQVVDLHGVAHQVEARPGDRLMEVLREYEWGVAAICGGLCSCGTCHVYLDESWMDHFPERDMDEEDLLDSLEFSKADSRLSCQLELREVHDGLSLAIAPEE